MLACFSRIIEHNKPQRRIHKDAQAILTITMEVTRSFL